MPVLHAQAAASLRGSVSDNQGASVPAAVVTLTSRATAATRRAVTTATGEYSFLQVAPGTYDVRVEKPGFSVAARNDVRLQVNVASTLDVALELGTVTETVNVEADAASVNTVDATVGNAFTETQVRQLPLLTRNVVELLSVQPGVTATGEVLGARRDQNNVVLDGVDANDNQNSGIRDTVGSLANGSNANGSPGDAGFNAALPVPLDSVQEFRVTVGGQGANQGRSSGGQVALVTKSGSNAFHGTLYEFHRNTVTSANNWFSNRAGIRREALIRNQYGASLGGRIVRDRAFFFVNWEDRKDRSAQAGSRTVPSDTLRQGLLRFRDSRGTLQTLSAADVREIDPLHLGLSPAMRAVLNSYPAGNDPSLGADAGLNFSGLRFNAPFTLNNRAYVAKVDLHLDGQDRHVLSLRGTLADNSEDVVIAQFPGQEPAARLLNNSRGMAAVYTGVLTPTLVNVFTFGLTRIGLEQAGTLGNSVSFDGVSSDLNYAAAARGFTRISPTYNMANDTTWTRGAHTVSAGANLRFVRNGLSSLRNSFASYSFSRNTLKNLGDDIIAATNTFLQQRSGDPTLSVASASRANLQRGFGTALGLLNQFSGTYNFERDGTALPFGEAVARNFATNEYEFYVQDSWKARRDLTLTAGVRYSNSTVPWETNGVQVGSTVGADVYFAERVGASLAGVPGRVLPNALLSYELNGPANGRPSWYSRDSNNWAPRVAFAYAPEVDGLLGRLFGKGSALRGSFGVFYDRYGNDLITAFDRTGSPGLASSVTQPANTDFTTSPRFDGASFPALPAPPPARFPLTPPAISGGFNSGVGIQPDLVAPYSFLMNLTYTRNVGGGIVVETGYIGRLSRKGLLQRDAFQPLTRFTDPRSGQNWAQASGQLRALVDRGVTPAMVKANPGLVGSQPFFENLFAPLANRYFAGSASANYFDLVYGQNGGSDLDGLNEVDRLLSPCAVVTGCNTFFALQNAGLRTWFNGGFANFHGGTLTVRRALQSGVAFDFNYTLSHSIDNSSAAESGAGNGGAIVQDAFDLGAFRGSSDFDVRHNISANGLLELPFGKGKPFLGSLPAWGNQVVGGWQVSSLVRYRSGLPTTVSNGGVYPTNYLNSSLAIRKPGAAIDPQVGLNDRGVPAIFARRDVASSFIGQYPGLTGTRAIARLDDLFNVDLSVAKSFTLPFEGHRLQFRAEAFNAFNNVNFFNASLSLDQPATFGEFRSAMAPRVMQFALRYEF